MHTVRPRRLAALASAAVFAVTTAATPVASAAIVDSAGVQECEEGESAARVRAGSAAKEPTTYRDAKKYGVIKDLPTLEPATVNIRTIFHVVSDGAIVGDERTRMEGMIISQMDVLNDAFSGTTSSFASDTAFRFTLTDTTWTDDPALASAAPGKVEKAMKAKLHVGNSETLNVYAADIGGGLLGYAYFPKGYNNGNDYLDGVVILDESMPGGEAIPYDEGDTLTHEVGHWLMLEHTFAGACSASGDGVADTPREAYPQFECGTYDTCPAPGLDPVRNFMDYTEDACMNMFTPGQADRMSDAWLAFRAGGNG